MSLLLPVTAFLPTPGFTDVVFYSVLVWFFRVRSNRLSDDHLKFGVPLQNDVLKRIAALSQRFLWPRTTRTAQMDV